VQLKVLLNIYLQIEKRLEVGISPIDKFNASILSRENFSNGIGPPSKKNPIYRAYKHSPPSRKNLISGRTDFEWGKSQQQSSFEWWKFHYRNARHYPL